MDGNDYHDGVVCRSPMGILPKRRRLSDNEDRALPEQPSQRIRTEPRREFNPISLLVRQIEPSEYYTPVCAFCHKTGEVRKLNCCNNNGCSNCIEESLIEDNKCTGCNKKIYFNYYLPVTTLIVPALNEQDASDYKEINETNDQAVPAQDSTQLLKEKIKKIIAKCHVKMSELRQSKRLGSGAFGLVSTTNYEFLSPKADGTVNTMHVAAKVWSDDDETSHYREMEFLQQLRHDNMVKYIAAVVDNDSKLCGYLMERHETTLEKFVEKNKETMHFYKFHLVKQLTDVVYFIHKHGFILRDLKPQNIMISEKKCVILIDFGTARQVASEMTPRVGTDSYMAPEVRAGRYCQKADVFSYGLVCHFIKEGHNPIQEDPDRNHLKIVKKHCDEFAKNQDTSFIAKIVALSTAFDPKDRKTMKEIYYEIAEEQSEEFAKNQDNSFTAKIGRFDPEAELYFLHEKRRRQIQVSSGHSNYVNGGRVPADPSEPAEGSPSSTNRPKEAQNSGQKNRGNEAKAEKKSRFFDGFPEETNILLLGMEGSGRAEFINSFPNYLKHENFDEALENGPEVVIPTDSFSLVQDPNSGKMNYIIAEAEQTQVSRETKKAQTEHKNLYDSSIPRTYRINQDRHWSIEQDKHLKNVLELVKNFGQIHAILIFVRSDEEHIISYTRYLEEAFEKLHYQASRNIIFCFTSIAKTSYRPGELAIRLLTRFSHFYNTGIRMRMRVAENNTFCFENDSYRLLCAQKEGVPLSENAISVGRKHWTLSVQETFRLLGHIKTLTPFYNTTVYTFCELMPVFSEFFYSRIVQIAVTDEEIQKLEKGWGTKEEGLRKLKERSDEFKRSFPKLVDFCVKLDTCVRKNVLSYNEYFSYLRDSLQWKKEAELDPSIKTTVTTYFEREKKHYWKEKETYLNYLEKTGSQITLEDIIAKELPAIEPYFAEESKEWKRILTEQQILSRPHSARLITITNDWYCNPHDRMWVNGMFVNI